MLGFISNLYLLAVCPLDTSVEKYGNSQFYSLIYPFTQHSTISHNILPFYTIFYHFYQQFTALPIYQPSDTPIHHFTQQFTTTYQESMVEEER